MRKNEKKILAALIFALVFVFSWSLVFAASYQNQEKIPGFEPTDCFNVYMKQIIMFGFAIIGILALFMLVIGAFQYLMAAGNVGKADSARETIGSAIFGLLLGLCAWIILEKINPDLVKLELPSGFSCSESTSSPNSNSNNNSSSSDTPSPNAGKCVSTDSGECAVSKMGCFGDQAKNASAICMCESGGVAKAGGDSCGSSDKVSYGLLQVNTSCHDLGMNCTSAFRNTKTGKKCCIGTGCSKSTCEVANSSLAQQCLKAMQDPAKNLAAACQIYKQSGWKPWSCAKPKHCGIIKS
jgi:hypothetical protein